MQQGQENIFLDLFSEILEIKNRISKMGKIPRKIRLDMNYLNLKEIKNLCDEFDIPYKILYRKGPFLLKTSKNDRKDVILERICFCLTTGDRPPPTVLDQEVVDLGPIPLQPKETDLIKFGQFKHGHEGTEDLLKKMSKGQFKDGALARDVLREFWVNGKAPTYKQFLKAWYQAVENHTQPKEEWAYLTDLGSGVDMNEWKKTRIKRAENAVLFIKENLIKNKKML